MNTALWIAQGALAAAYVLNALPKLRLSPEELRERLPFTEDFSTRTVRLVGVAELAGAVGLIVPWATGIAPVLTPVAAIGLGLLMVGAMATHLRRREFAYVPLNLALLATSVFIAAGRL